MQPIYFTPGPSQLYPGFAAHMQNALAEGVASVSHRSKAAEGWMKATTEALRALMGIPSEYALLFLPSATECWERILQNCVAKESFHLVNGSFSEKFYKTARHMGRASTAYTVPQGQGFDISQIEVPASAELIAAIANETSTGAMMSPIEIKTLRERYPDKLLAVDVVTAAPHAEIDYAQTDLAYVSVQKGFGMPAGLALLVVSPRALEKAKKLEADGQYTGSHHSFSLLDMNARVFQTPCTPNVLFIHLLGKVAQDMLHKGIEVIRSETRQKAAMIYSAFEASARLKPLVAHLPHRSETVLVAEVEGGNAELLADLKSKGLLVGGGYSQFKTAHIRVANFPAHRVEDMERLAEELGS